MTPDEIRQRLRDREALRVKLIREPRLAELTNENFKVILDVVEQHIAEALHRRALTETDPYAVVALNAIASVERDRKRRAEQARQDMIGSVMFGDFGDFEDPWGD